MAYKNKEDALAYAKKYRKENAEKRKKQAKQYYEENHKRIHKYQKQYREDNREQIRERDSQYYKENIEAIKEYSRKWHLKDKFNLSHEDWLKIWNNQNGKCAICKIVFPTPSDACVDHDHKTGKIRGLLCIKCNAGIGYLNDDPKITSMATEYLLKI